MKISGFIFSFYILFLALQPVLKEINLFGATTKQCCCGKFCEPIDQSQPEKQPDKKTPNDDICNPFQACKCCIGFNNDVIFLNFSPDNSFGGNYVVSNEKVPAEITVDFWQPPKIA